MRTRWRVSLGVLAMAGVWGLASWGSPGSPSPAAPPPAPPLRASASTPAPAPVPVPMPDADPGEQATPDDRALDAAHEVIRELEVEAWGHPLAWDDSIPASHRPETVIPTIERVVDDCDIAFPLLGFDCACVRHRARRPAVESRRCRLTDRESAFFADVDRGT